jgi:5'-nucleotidase
MKTRRPWASAALVVFLLALAGGCAGAETAPLKILVSNDDGIEAPGLAALVDALRGVGTVTVAASVREQSGVSHAMTSKTLIPVRESVRNGVRWIGVDATPASSVRLAIEALLPSKPDLVVSGINRGENVGLVTFYSATVGAAREAAFLRIPAIAVNLQSGGDMNYKAAAGFVAALVRELARKGFEKGMLLNVNVPALPPDKIKGIKITRQDLQPTVEFFEKKESREGRDFYWPSYKVLPGGPEGTDIWAVRNGFISITPLSLDQTGPAALQSLKSLERLAWK